MHGRTAQSPLWGPPCTLTANIFRSYKGWAEPISIFKRPKNKTPLLGPVWEKSWAIRGLNFLGLHNATAEPQLGNHRRSAAEHEFFLLYTSSWTLSRVLKKRIGWIEHTPIRTRKSWSGKLRRIHRGKLYKSNRLHWHFLDWVMQLCWYYNTTPGEITHLMLRSGQSLRPRGSSWLERVNVNLPVHVTDR